jgi:integrase
LPQKPAMLNDGGGLYLRVAQGAGETIHKTWIFRYSVEGRDRQLSLGSFPDVSLGEARDDADAQRKLRRQDIDPIAERRRLAEVKKADQAAQKAAAALEAARSKTFQTCAEEYIAAHESKWSSPAYRAQWKSTLAAYAYPVIGQVAVADVTSEMVLQVLRPHWSTATATMKKLRARIAKVLGYAACKGYRSNGPNPAAWVDGLEHPLPAPSEIAPTKHHAALKYEKIGAFMAELRKDERISAKALAFAILTCARSHEVRFAPWSEIDINKRLWTIPVERLKMRREEDRPPHTVPLSAAACAILKGIKGDRTTEPDDLIFAGRTGRRLADNALRKAARRIDPTISAHGFRSTFKDRAGDRANAPDEVSEFCLGHVKTGLAAAYRRRTAVEKRRELMGLWADYCDVIEGDNVTTFKRSA